MSLAENIRFYRKREGMYQSDLGQYLGVSAQAVSKWELGKAEPDKECIGKMCALFQVSSDTLMGITTPHVSSEPWNPDAMDYADQQDKSISVMARGMSKMSPENRQKLLDMARLMFGKDFDEQGNKKE